MTETGETLVEARGLTVERDGRRVLDHVDLAVRRGEVVTLVGLNGSGKSTLVKTLLGLVAPSAGEVRRSPGLRIGYTPQSLSLDAVLPLTVARFLTLGGSASRARVAETLEEVGVAALAERQMAQVSGGELHRVMLARALLRAPDLLALDEPMSGVDVSGQSELYRLIAGLRDRYRCGVLLVSHDLHLVMAETDNVVCLNHHVCCTGKPRAVVRNPAFSATFGQAVADALAVYVHAHDHAHDLHGEVAPLGHEHAHGHHHASTSPA
jgi:zinc transport system ATP-binding protein